MQDVIVDSMHAWKEDGKIGCRIEYCIVFNFN
jgi:hypothetical protein